jgi:hypothetical protein
MHQHSVYGFGYQGVDFDAFVRKVKTLGATVIDTRLRPVSRTHIWNRKRLAAALGDAYEWVQDLGNLNYKGGPIELQDLEQGLHAARRRLALGPIVLLCVCRDVSGCHRNVILQRLAGEGHPVEAFMLSRAEVH